MTFPTHRPFSGHTRLFPIDSSFMCFGDFHPSSSPFISLSVASTEGKCSLYCSHEGCSILQPVIGAFLWSGWQASISKPPYANWCRRPSPFLHSIRTPYEIEQDKEPRRGSPCKRWYYTSSDPKTRLKAHAILCSVEGWLGSRKLCSEI